MQAYILNTGSIGAKDGTAGEKISIKISTEIMKQIAKEGIRWERDPDWGYEVPVERSGHRSRQVQSAQPLLRAGVSGAHRQAARRAARLAGEVPGSRPRDPEGDRALIPPSPRSWGEGPDESGAV